MITGIPDDPKCVVSPQNKLQHDFFQKMLQCTNIKYIKLTNNFLEEVTFYKYFFKNKTQNIANSHVGYLNISCVNLFNKTLKILSIKYSLQESNDRYVWHAFSISLSDNDHGPGGDPAQIAEWSDRRWVAAGSSSLCLWKGPPCLL